MMMTIITAHSGNFFCLEGGIGVTVISHGVFRGYMGLGRLVLKSWMPVAIHRDGTGYNGSDGYRIHGFDTPGEHATSKKWTLRRWAHTNGPRHFEHLPVCNTLFSLYAISISIVRADS